MTTRVWVMTVCFGLLFALAAWPEGTVTETRRTMGLPDRVELAWTSSTNGWASGSTKYVRGQIVRVVYSNAVGVTDQYDVTLADEFGLDVLSGTGTNLATNVVTTIVPAEISRDADHPAISDILVPIHVNDRLSLVVTNCGNETSGEVIVYVR